MFNITSGYQPTLINMCPLQDLLSELQSVCQCCEAVLPPVVPVVKSAEVGLTHELEGKAEKTPEVKQPTGAKRKRASEAPGGPPAKKILGDGTRSSSTPVTWKSSSSGIVIQYAHRAPVQLKIHYFETVSFSSDLNVKHIFFANVFFSDLTMEIVRYRLIGPQSHTVLAETLEAATDCDVRNDYIDNSKNA